MRRRNSRGGSAESGELDGLGVRVLSSRPETGVSQTEVQSEVDEVKSENRVEQPSLPDITRSTTSKSECSLLPVSPVLLSEPSPAHRPNPPSPPPPPPHPRESLRLLSPSQPLTRTALPALATLPTHPPPAFLLRSSEDSLLRPDNSRRRRIRTRSRTTSSTESMLPCLSASLSSRK